jgi:hypothetical protein
MDQQTQAPSNQQPAPQSGNFMQQLENFFDTYLHKKAPFHLPPQAKEWIVKYGPWITLVLMIIAVPVILAALGMAAIFAPAAVVYGGYKTDFMISGLFSLAALVLEAAALPGLFKRSIHGWRMVYYSCLVTAVGELISFNIIGLIIGLAISMYFLFEIKEYYK